MFLPALATAIYAVTFVAEKVMLRGHRRRAGEDRDRFSLAVFDVSGALTIPPGIVLGFTEVGRIHGWGALASAVGLALLISGTVLRWAAVFTLKKYFTVNVTIFEDHRLVREGLYRHLRHPSYTGLLLRYLGLGLAYANWLSLALVFLPMLGAVLYRMRVEERALSEAFGAGYAEYARSTKRLIPGVY